MSYDDLLSPSSALATTGLFLGLIFGIVLTIAGRDALHRFRRSASDKSKTPRKRKRTERADRS